MSQIESKVSVILVDDHRILRQGLSALLEKQSNLELVAEAETGMEAIKLVKTYEPDVVVMDIALSDLNGIEATRQIMTAKPKTKIIGLSVHSDRQYVEGMFKAGAKGYLLKDCSLNDLISAIEAVTSGQTYLSPRIAGIIVNNLFHKKSMAIDSLLSPREREVLCLLAQGGTRSSIAEMLFISPRTVETHRRRIMKKLDIRNMADLIKFSIREGLTTLEK
jgi:DNA-binding NarL/FixJ family response regulator